MKNKSIDLIGFMGVGKSMVSKRLGEVLKRKVVSTDRLIEEKEGASIERIFEEKGEAYFRRLEKSVLDDVFKNSKVILDCGGGIVLNPKNLEFLKKKTVLICLAASADFIYQMVKQQRNRPLLNVEDPRKAIRDLLKKRRPLYAQAHFTISTEHKTADQIVEEVLKIISDE